MINCCQRRPTRAARAATLPRLAASGEQRALANEHLCERLWTSESTCQRRVLRPAQPRALAALTLADLPKVGRARQASAPGSRRSSSLQWRPAGKLAGACSCRLQVAGCGARALCLRSESPSSLEETQPEMAELWLPKRRQTTGRQSSVVAAAAAAVASHSRRARLLANYMRSRTKAEAQAEANVQAPANVQIMQANGRASPLVRSCSLFLLPFEPKRIGGCCC